MVTPYSSWSNVHKALRQEYPVAISAYGEVVREQLDLHHFGPASEGDFASSGSSGGTDWGGIFESVLKVAPVVIDATRRNGPILSQTLGGNRSTTTAAPTPPPAEKGISKTMIIGIGAGVVLIIAVVVIKLKFGR